MTSIKNIYKLIINKIGIIIPALVIFLFGVSLFREWEGLKQFSWSITPLWIIVSFIAYSCQLVLMFIIWHLIMTTIGEHSNFNLNINAFFFSSLAKRIPTVVPFLGVRFHLYRENSQSNNSTVFIGSLIEVFILIISGGLFIPLLGIIFVDQMGIIARGAWIFSVLIGIFIICPKGFTSLATNIIKRIGKGAVPPLINPKILIFMVGISLVSYVLNAISIHCLILGITQQSIAFQDTIIASSFYYLLTYLTMYLVGGFGIKEIVFGLLMRPHIVFPVGVIIAFIIRLMMIIVETILYITVRRVYKMENFSE